MSWPRKVLYTAVLSSIIIAKAAGADNIRDVSIRTLQNSPEYLASVAKRLQGDQNYRQALSGYLPTFDISGALGREKTNNSTTRDVNDGSVTLTRRESSFLVNQMLFDGFSVKNNVDSNVALINSAAYDALSVAENVVIRVIEAYLEVLRKRILVLYAKENFSNHQLIFQQMKLKAESGIAKKADLDQATGRLALARTNLLEEQANLRDSETNFLRITGFKPGDLYRPSIDDTVIPATEDAAVTIAVSRHPSVVKSVYDVESALSKKRQARSPYFPSLNFEISGSDNKNLSGSRSKSDNLTFLLKFNYNIFRGGGDAANERSAAWAVEENKEVERQVRRQIEQSVRLSWNAYTNAKAQLNYRREHAEAMQRTRDAYQKQFGIGQRTLLDLLDSENELFSSKSAYISAQFSELLGKYRVLNSMGNLTEHLNIMLPEIKEHTGGSWWEGF